MSEETREALLAWIEAEEAGQGHTAQRLAVCAASVTDESVPQGWVRLILTSREPAPALQSESFAPARWRSFCAVGRYGLRRRPYDTRERATLPRARL